MRDAEPVIIREKPKLRCDVVVVLEVDESTPLETIAQYCALLVQVIRPPPGLNAVQSNLIIAKGARIEKDANGMARIEAASLVTVEGSLPPNEKIEVPR